jgi:hypothetical protein
VERRRRAVSVSVWAGFGGSVVGWLLIDEVVDSSPVVPVRTFRLLR